MCTAESYDFETYDVLSNDCSLHGSYTEFAQGYPSWVAFPLPHIARAMRKIENTRHVMTWFIATAVSFVIGIDTG